MYVTSTAELVGNTPLVELTKIEAKYGLKARLFAKVEYFNPAGSVKDRVALSLIKDAEKQGKIAPGYTLIEPTSGNTGIGLAAIGVSRGYKVILTMPESMSLERRKLLLAYGAEIVLTPASEGMQGAVDKAEALIKEIPSSVILGQFDNPANVAAHYQGTGPEIYLDLKGEVDVFIAGIGTGGTISGVGAYLKEMNPNVKVVGVEPESSPLLSKGQAGPHKIQGIGANFVPSILNRDVIDEIMPIGNDDAFAFGKEASKTEGLLVGISSGAALAAGIALAKRKEYEGKNIVVLFPDSGDRYLSTYLFA